MTRGATDEGSTASIHHRQRKLTLGSGRRSEVFCRGEMRGRRESESVGDEKRPKKRSRKRARKRARKRVGSLLRGPWCWSVDALGGSKDGRIIHPHRGATSNFAVTMWSRDGRARALSEGDQGTAGRGGWSAGPPEGLLRRRATFVRMLGSRGGSWGLLSPLQGWCSRPRGTV